MHRDSIPYMGFEWEGTFYVYNCAPFGLATVPWAFTLLVRSVLNHLRKQGHRCSSYIDDSVYFNQCPVKLAAIQKGVLELFAELGLLVNFKKSQLDIRQWCIYLGMHLDLQKGIFIVPSEKRAQLLVLISLALENPNKVHVRDLARIKGKLASMSWAFGITAKLFTRAMDRDIARAVSWNCTLQLHSACVDELRFWQCQFDRFNGVKPMWSTEASRVVIHVDAAGRSKSAGGGWGAWCVLTGTRHDAQGQWQSAADSSMSSTAQELQACLFALQSFRHLLQVSVHKQLNVQVLTDSMNVVHALMHGDVKAVDSVKMAQDIFLYTFSQQLATTFAWVPREQNSDADSLSKLVDKEDCRLNPHIFTDLQQRFGPCHIDLFASHASRQVQQYFSKYYTPDTLGVDAFCFDWKQYGMCWAYPPFRVIADVITHARKCKAQVCTLVPDSGKFASFVTAFHLLQPAHDTLLVLNKEGEWSPKGSTGWKMVLLCLDFDSCTSRPRLDWPH